jgi:hypothetical protein
MKKTLTLFSLISVLGAAGLAHAHGGEGKAPVAPDLTPKSGSAHKAHAHAAAAHHHHHSAMDCALTAGKQLGFQQNAQGNYDAVNRIIINTTTEKVLDESDAIDTMLANDLIAPDGWMMLKSTMAESMENAAAAQETSPELPAQAAGGQALGAGEAGFEESISTTDRTGENVVETDSDLSTYSSGKASGLPRAVASSNSSDTNGSVSPASANFSGFALPMVSASGVAAAPSSDREPASVVALKDSKPSVQSTSDSAHSASFSANEQRTLALAQALAAKHDATVESPRKTPEPKKKPAFPDPIRAIFGKSKAKYANVKTKSPLTKFTAEKSGLTVALPAAEAEGDFEQEQEQDESNWTLLFLLAMGVFGMSAALYVAWKRPRKSTIQLMVPSNGEHFTIRASNNQGEYILDIKDARGNLVRSAGMLRPQSVARAAVLPPTLAAQLGAEGSFDRFEFTENGEFRPTEKEEGYQIFPFVLN